MFPVSNECVAWGQKQKRQPHNQQRKEQPGLVYMWFLRGPRKFDKTCRNWDRYCKRFFEGIPLHDKAWSYSAVWKRLCNNFQLFCPVSLRKVSWRSQVCQNSASRQFWQIKMEKRDCVPTFTLRERRFQRSLKELSRNVISWTKEFIVIVYLYLTYSEAFLGWIGGLNRNSKY